MVTDREQILIAGAGPVGLVAALQLARMGRPVRIVDARQVPSQQSKAIAVNARTLELLEASGVTERLLELGRKIPGLDFWRGDQILFRIRFSTIAHRYNFMLALPQCQTERTLEQRLNEFGVQVERSTELVGFSQDDGSVHCVLSRHGNEEAFEAAYLIGADGAHSTVRKGLGIDFRGQAVAGEWSLADVVMDTPLDRDRVNLMIQDDGIFLQIRIKDSIFRLASNQPNVLDRVPPGSKVHRVIWRSDFGVSHRQAETYGMGRVFIAGDAAHIHSPLGGRGMNLGVEDAVDLVDRIASNSVEQYSDARLRTGAEVIRMVTAQTRVATSTNPAVKFIRDRLLPLILRRDAVQRRLVPRMLGLEAPFKTPALRNCPGGP